MKKKKTPCTSLIITLIIGMTMVGVRVGASPQPLLYVDPPTYTATTLGEFTIDINIANASNLQVAEFNLRYNTTILDATNVAEGPFMKAFGETLMYREIHDDLGYLLVAIAIMEGGPAEGNGTLATITFNATYYGSVSCALDLYYTGLSDLDGKPINHDVADGYYEFVILSLTVATSKQTYDATENIDLYGNLTRDGSPVDGSVALEVKDPSNKTIIFRTLQTGTNPPDGNITILDMYPCDAFGNPKNSFKRGPTYLANFKVTVKNSDVIERNVTITVNTFDGNTVPFGTAALYQYPISPGANITFIPSVPIPEWAYIGTARVYVSALTDFPSLGGVAYCPEESAAFEITGSTAALGAQEPNINPPAVRSLTDPTGSYNLTFKVFSGEEGLADRRRIIGNYTVYVSSSYQKQHNEDNTTFKIKVPADANGDDRVNIDDLILFTDSWYKKIGDPDYNPNADFNKDGIVDIDDLIILTNNWYKW